RLVRQVRERRFAVRPPGHEAAGDTHLRSIGFASCRVQRYGLGRAMGPVERIGERRDTSRDERVQLIATSPLDEVRLIGHAATLPPPPPPPFPPAALPDFVRYASMNGSMSPSITRCTSGIFNSV